MSSTMDGKPGKGVNEQVSGLSEGVRDGWGTGWRVRQASGLSEGEVMGGTPDGEPGEQMNELAVRGSSNGQGASRRARRVSKPAMGRAPDGKLGEQVGCQKEWQRGGTGAGQASKWAVMGVAIKRR